MEAIKKRPATLNLRTYVFFFYNEVSKRILSASINFDIRHLNYKVVDLHSFFNITNELKNILFFYYLVIFLVPNYLFSADNKLEIICIMNEDDSSHKRNVYLKINTSIYCRLAPLINNHHHFSSINWIYKFERLVHRNSNEWQLFHLNIMNLRMC